jgi:hypothetical protein
MAKIILFGGSDGGGIVIGPNGVTPIPPFDPAMLLQFESVSRLLRAERQLGNADTRGQLAVAINSVTNLLVSQVEDTIGEVDEDSGIVFLGEDGGFTCGSSGRPPIPLPWPPRDVPSMEEIISRRVIRDDTVAFLEAAAAYNADFEALFDNPKREAERLGLDLPSEVASQVRALNLNNADRITDPVDREVVSFFQATVKDGQYLAEWASEPARVAELVGFPISQAAVERIGTVSQLVAREQYGENRIIWIVVGIVVIVAVVATEGEAEIADLSGIEKF